MSLHILPHTDHAFSYTKQGTEAVNSIARDWVLGRKKGDLEAKEKRFMGQGLSD